MIVIYEVYDSQIYVFEFPMAEGDDGLVNQNSGSLSVTFSMLPWLYTPVVGKYLLNSQMLRRCLHVDVGKKGLNPDKR